MSETTNEKAIDHKVVKEAIPVSWEQVSSYEEAEQYLLEIPKFTRKHSLEETRCFLRVLGVPDENEKIIHVAGTNGKGSVCAYLCSILTQAGYRVGMFTSPHLVEMRERFRVGKELISKERFLWSLLCDGTVGRNAESVRKCPVPSDFFELLFLMEWYCFKK